VTCQGLCVELVRVSTKQNPQWSHAELLVSMIFLILSAFEKTYDDALELRSLSLSVAAIPRGSNESISTIVFDFKDIRSVIIAPSQNTVVLTIHPCPNSSHDTAQQRFTVGSPVWCITTQGSYVDRSCALPCPGPKIFVPLAIALIG
jgi:hypothetical protein